MRCFAGVKYRKLIEKLPTIFEQNQSFLPRIQIKGLFDGHFSQKWKIYSKVTLI